MIQWGKKRWWFDFLILCRITFAYIRHSSIVFPLLEFMRIRIMNYRIFCCFTLCGVLKCLWHWKKLKIPMQAKQIRATTEKSITAWLLNCSSVSLCFGMKTEKKGDKLHIIKQALMMKRFPWDAMTFAWHSDNDLFVLNALSMPDLVRWGKH